MIEQISVEFTRELLGLAGAVGFLGGILFSIAFGLAINEMAKCRKTKKNLMCKKCAEIYNI